MVTHHQGISRRGHDDPRQSPNPTPRHSRTPRRPQPPSSGHSLESDLKAPSASTPHSSTTTPAVDLLNRGSHGSPRNGITTRSKRAARAAEDDARACVDLLRLKIQKGAKFGFKTDHGVVERMARACGRIGQGAVRAAVVDHSNPDVRRQCHDRHRVRERSRDLIQAIPMYVFLFGRLYGHCGRHGL
jgi:RNA exonuclease 1